MDPTIVRPPSAVLFTLKHSRFSENESVADRFELLFHIAVSFENQKSTMIPVFQLFAEELQ